MPCPIGFCISSRDLWTTLTITVFSLLTQFLIAPSAESGASRLIWCSSMFPYSHQHRIRIASGLFPVPIHIRTHTFRLRLVEWHEMQPQWMPLDQGRPRPMGQVASIRRIRNYQWELQADTFALQSEVNIRWSLWRGSATDRVPSYELSADSRVHKTTDRDPLYPIAILWQSIGFQSEVWGRVPDIVLVVFDILYDVNLEDGNRQGKSAKSHESVIRTRKVFLFPASFRDSPEQGRWFLVVKWSLGFALVLRFREVEILYPPGGSLILPWDI